jgi:hypothetical protein
MSFRTYVTIVYRCARFPVARGRAMRLLVFIDSVGSGADCILECGMVRPF